LTFVVWLNSSITFLPLFSFQGPFFPAAVFRRQEVILSLCRFPVNWYFMLTAPALSFFTAVSGRQEAILSLPALLVNSQLMGCHKSGDLYILAFLNAPVNCVQ